MLVPKRSAWLIIVTKPSTSSTPVRIARWRKARSRSAPARSSRFTSRSSSASAGLLSCKSSATRSIAASVPRPASMHTVMRSQRIREGLEDLPLTPPKPLGIGTGRGRTGSVSGRCRTAPQGCDNLPIRRPPPL